MPSLQRIRRRLPLVVALLLVLMAFTAVGFACACMSDHPLQGIERAVAASVASAAASVAIAPPATDELWAMIAIVAMVSLVLAAAERSGYGRASPERLQRFRF